MLVLVLVLVVVVVVVVQKIQKPLPDTSKLVPWYQKKKVWYGGGHSVRTYNVMSQHVRTYYHIFLVRTYVYSSTINGTRVRTPWYHRYSSTMVPWYVLHVYILEYVLEYEAKAATTTRTTIPVALRGTRVPWYYSSTIWYVLYGHTYT